LTLIKKYTLYEFIKIGAYAYREKMVGLDFFAANLLHDLNWTDMDITYLRYKRAGAYHIYENPGVIIKKIS